VPGPTRDPLDPIAVAVGQPSTAPLDKPQTSRLYIEYMAVIVKAAPKARSERGW
jgi:hypothetical protein